ncbi:MAG: hypothetical protein HC892_17175 [Saprospiraceae bacterium]|nr:hypothetical protein [Saprospiraceae bacterium]
MPFYIEANILKGLKYTVNFGPDVRLLRRGEFIGRNTTEIAVVFSNALINNEEESGYTLENILNFNRTLGTKHNLGITALQSIQSLRFERHESAVSNLPYESQLFYNIGTASVKGNFTL